MCMFIHIHIHTDTHRHICIYYVHKQLLVCILTHTHTHTYTYTHTCTQTCNHKCIHMHTTHTLDQYIVLFSTELSEDSARTIVLCTFGAHTYREVTRTQLTSAICYFTKGDERKMVSKKEKHELVGPWPKCSSKRDCDDKTRN